MNLHREDAYCPACPDPETAFRIEDVGMKLVSEDLDLDAGAMHIKVSRPAWEPLMLEHLRSHLDDDEHRRVYNMCVIELIAAGMSAEDIARDSVQAAAASARRLLEQSMRRHQ